jgi:DNA processing protein
LIEAKIFDAEKRRRSYFSVFIEQLHNLDNLFYNRVVNLFWKQIMQISSVNTILQIEPNYPPKLLTILGDKAPEKIYVWGNLDLLHKPAVGFCGSRNVSEKGLDITSDIAKQIAKFGWVVVSGHARGVDTTAHRTALENNAGTIIVLPQGIDSFRLRAELKKIAKKENLLIISEFPRNAGWAVGRAMQRNRTIISLSSAMVLVESRTEGGTFNAGKDTLGYQQPLFVVKYGSTEESNAGNQYFIQRGAKQLLKNPVTMLANIEELQVAVEKHQHGNNKVVKPSQLSLFEGEKL